MMNTRRYIQSLVFAAAWLILSGNYQAMADNVTVISSGGHNFSSLTNVHLPAGRVNVFEGAPGVDNIVPKFPGQPVMEELILQRPLGNDDSWRAWRQEVHDFGSGGESHTLAVSILVLGATITIEYLSAWPSAYEIYAGPNDEPMERLVIQYTAIDLFP